MLEKDDGRSNINTSKDTPRPIGNLFILSNHSIAGAISGCTTRLLCQPFDVIKIRFQLQTEPISRLNKNSKYKGMVQAAKMIFQEEGIVGLWRGHVPAQFLSIVYGVIQFQVYESVKSRLSSYSPSLKKTDVSSSVDSVVNKKTTVHFISGGIAGCAGTFISFPFDVLRTRIVAQGNNKVYHGVMEGFVAIYKYEGVRSYWRGLSPALIVAGPFIGFQFAFYELYKNVLKNLKIFSVDGLKQVPNTAGTFVAGSLAGICSKTITYPFDLARKRLQLQEFQHARVGFGMNFWCIGLINCFMTTLKTERFLGIFKGYIPSMVKSSISTALHFAVYEKCLKFLNTYK